MAELILRRMTLHDVPQVHAIEHATFPTPWSLDSFEKEAVLAKYHAKINANLENRSRMLEAAKSGDPAAMESLSLDDMNTYGQISRRIVKEDIYSIVDTCFMPTGVECDNYMVIGEILSYELVENSWTGEKIYRMVISCNGIDITIGINQKDLMGEPQVGRRFKGDIWLQGIGHFDERAAEI